MSDAERQFHQEAAIVDAQPERGRLHVHFNVHPFVSLIITVVICFILLITWAAYAIFHHEEFVAQTAGLFTDGIWVIKALVIIGLVYLGVIVVGQFISKIVQPVLHSIQIGLYAIGQVKRNKVLTAQANYAIVHHKEGPQFYRVSQVPANKEATIAPAQDVPRLPAPTQQMPTQGYAINQLQHNGLQVCLGTSAATGKPYVRDLIGGTHYKIIGGSGFGKSCYAGSILDQVTSTNDPNRLSIALLDLEHKTSRLFENLPHVAQLRIGRKLVDCIAQDPDEVGEHLGYLHQELDRRTALAEYDLQRERLLLIYVEEFLSLKYEIDSSMAAKMMADFTILALRARKYRMYLLACAQVSYSDKNLREAENQFNVRASFSVAPTAAKSAGFIAGPLLKKNFEAKVPGQLVLETSGCTDIMLAPQFDVKQKLAELDGSNDVQWQFNGLNVHDFSSAMNGNERIVDAGSSDVERSTLMAEMARLYDKGWHNKQEVVEKVCKCKKGGTKAWADGSSMWDEMVMSKNEIGA